jgi:DNA-directed RNA polymerase specialized sigma24 family protein
MFHDEGVSVAHLAEALAYSHYEDLFRLVLFLNGGQVSAGSVVQDTLVLAVEKRNRFWNETSLKAWLYRLAYQTTQSSLKKGAPPTGPGEELFPPSVSIEKRPAQRPDLALILRCGHHLTRSEIAYVLAVDEASITERLYQERLRQYGLRYPDQDLRGCQDCLRLVNDRQDGLLDGSQEADLNRRLGDHPACRAYAGRLVEVEYDAVRQTGTLDVGPGEAGLITAASETAAAAVRKSRARRLALPVKELALFIGVLAMLAVLGRAWGVFEAFDARPTSTSLPRPTPTPTQPLTLPSEAPLFMRELEDRPHFYYSYPVKLEDTFESIAEGAGLPVEVIRYINRNYGTNLSPGQILQLPAILPGFEENNPAVGQPPLLSANSSLDEVLERVEIGNRYWQSLWVDFSEVNYGLSANSEIPDRITRSQIWSRPPLHSLIVRGGINDNSHYVGYRLGNIIFYQFQNYEPWWGNFSDGREQFLDEDLLAGLIKNGLSLSVVGEGITAGRPAVILEGYNPAGLRLREIWIDAETGLTLIQREFHEGDVSTVVAETIANTISYDIEFSEDFFYPPSKSYNHFTHDLSGFPLSQSNVDPSVAWDELSTRAPITEYITPPPGWNPVREELVLQLRSDTYPQGELASARYIDVFTGDYHLGEFDLELEASSFVDCRRSEDGRVVLFLASSDRLYHYNLYWFNLDEPLELSNLNRNSYIYNMTLSDNGSKLVFWGCAVGCGLHFLDLESGAVEWLAFNPGTSFSFIWGPDGEQIAYIESDLDPNMNHLNIIDAESHEIVYQASFISENWEGAIAASPAAGWGLRPDIEYPAVCWLP